MNTYTKCFLASLSKYIPAEALPGILSLIKEGESSTNGYFEYLGVDGELEYKQLELDIQFINEVCFNDALKFIFYLKHSKSQMRQDIHVLLNSGFKKNGYFVEIGATDGVSFSNTYLLEKYMDWNGIVVEPSPQYSKVIRENRRCNIETKCVYSKSGHSVEFIEVQGSSLSGITKYNDSNRPELRDANSEKFFKETISLNDLLDFYEAPSEIDYISIDTEGSELTILQSFHFRKFKVKFFSVEHNFTAQRDEIYRLMQNNGYKRILEKYSQWDDWYVLSQ